MASGAGEGNGSGWETLGADLVGPLSVLIDDGDASVRHSTAVYEEGHWLDLRTEDGLETVSLAIGPESYAFLRRVLSEGG